MVQRGSLGGVGEQRRGERMPVMKPLPYTDAERTRQLTFRSFPLAFYICLSFAFVSVFGLVFIVLEKETEVKLHQFINGVSIVIYWVTNSIWDAGMFLIPICGILVLLWTFQVDVLIGDKLVGTFVGLLFLFVW
jgi:hypothetical protein